MVIRKPQLIMSHLLILICTMGLLTGLSINKSNAQDANISIELNLEPQLTKAQVLSLSNLGIDQTGQGTPLFNLVIRNNDNVEQENLYFTIQVTSQKKGMIVELFQEPGSPFSLGPLQVVVGNNNQLQDGLPGVEENIRFDGGLTETGENFLNDLEGSTKLPSDIYTVVVSIYQPNNSRNGGTLVASEEQTLGENLISDTSIDLYLLQPGGELGSQEVINTSLPVFRWEGPTNINYRLLVVEDNGQSPEALLQSAQSSEPTIVNGMTGEGSLLQFEIIDAVANNLTFATPPSGIQELQAGKHYFWQVLTNLEGVDATESIPSEIWEFTVTDTETQELSAVREEVETALQRVLGGSRFERLKQQGFKFNSITIDGQTFSGASAFQKLKELQQRLENGEISIVIN